MDIWAEATAGETESQGLTAASEEGELRCD